MVAATRRGAAVMRLVGTALALVSLLMWGCVVNPVPTPGSSGAPMLDQTADGGQRAEPKDKEDNDATTKADSSSPTSNVGDTAPPPADAGAAADVAMPDDVSGTGETTVDGDGWLDEDGAG